MTDNNISNVTFHDSAVRGFYQNGSNITIELDGVSIEDGSGGENLFSAIVIIDNVKKIFRNSAPVNSIHKEKGDGELYDLEQEGDKIIVSIQWEEYNPSCSDFVVYDIVGGEMSFKLTSCHKV
jgi:hypothetical protein